MIIFGKQEPEYFYFKNMFLVSTIFFVSINIFFIITKFISKNIFLSFLLT